MVALLLVSIGPYLLLIVASTLLKPPQLLHELIFAFGLHRRLLFNHINFYLFSYLYSDQVVVVA